jgi:hypothetical protein
MFMSPQLAARIRVTSKIKSGMIAAMMLSDNVQSGKVQPQDFHPILDNILNLVVKDVFASKLLIRTEPSLN